MDAYWEPLVRAALVLRHFAVPAAIGSAAIAGVLATSAFVVRPNQRRLRRMLEELEERREVAVEMFEALHNNEAALLRSSDRFRSLFEQNPNGMVMISTDGNINRMNVEAEHLTGYLNEDLVGKHYSMLASPSDREAAAARAARAIAGEAVSYEHRVLRRDGTEMVVRVDASPIRVGDRLEGAFLILKDLTVERALQRRLQERDDRVRGLYVVASSPAEAGQQIDEALGLGVRAFGMSYGFVGHVSEGILTVRHRCGPDDFLPIGSRVAVLPSIAGRLATSARTVAIEDLTVEPYASELRERGWPWKSCIASSIVAGDVRYGTLIFLDRSVRSSAFENADLDFSDLMSSVIGSAVTRETRQAVLHDMAFHDKLTGLANRRVLEEHLRRVVAQARRAGTSLAVHYIDLDGFKPINDVYGHAFGDEVLREVARRFSGVLREHDVLARVGGDEFVAVQIAITDANAVANLARRLAASLDHPIVLPTGEDASIGASFGVALYPENGTTPAELLEAADAAMFVRKRLRA